ncbi:MAG TPA: hypothetical protein DCM14_04075 [Clostridiales bacterium UBA8153]|nr:hypothetical protein [Clostridiales bacterium UBA8153]
MYLHIGADACVAMRDVVAIISHKLMELSPVNREFIGSAEAERRVFRSADGRFASAVVTTTAVYLTPTTPATLVRRARSGFGSGQLGREARA